MVANLPENYEQKYSDAHFLRVVSPLKALQRLAERHREEYDLPVVGVTGSNGKLWLRSGFISYFRGRVM